MTPFEERLFEERLQERLVALETQLAFQDDLLESLNGQVAWQSNEIQLLQAQLRLLNERLASRKEAGSDLTSRLVDDEKPPHY